MAVRGVVRLAAWCLALAVTLTVLHRASVPVVVVDLASREPSDLLPLLLVGGRWVALGCAWYLAGATALALLSAVLAWRPLRRLDAALTLPAIRQLVRAGIGASLVVGLGLGPTAAAAAAPGPPGASAQPAPLAELDELPVADAPIAPRVAGASAATTDDTADGGEAATHEVVAGDSFWSIAAELTAAELGRAPEDEEVVERWIALIEANRDRLLVPDDPDLLLPGQRLRLPGDPA